LLAVGVRLGNAKGILKFHTLQTVQRILVVIWV
jgi:hypothetical protein